MPSRAGAPIWYELMTPDPDGAKRFYDHVVGWKVDAQAAGDVDYRMIAAPGGLVGGVLGLTDEMQAHGARPAWLAYFAADDVDATARQAQSLGAHILVPPRDVEGVGRFALLADPQGAPFYIMRAVGEQSFSPFAQDEPGRCGWNELSTTDMHASLAFYGALFGWENRETMDMGPMGGYHFLDLGDVRLGAAAEMRDRPAHWNFYFCVADFDAAIEQVRAGGGTIDMGPHEVPSGNRIVLATDPQHARFALVSRGTSPPA